MKGPMIILRLNETAVRIASKTRMDDVYSKIILWNFMQVFKEETLCNVMK